ncbi:type IX secretion system anionic LPS delivery protein PorZ [Neotamlana laminarinivorans]|uniref:ABC transporter substrate-binding protein n=1 Tax=Neotamlana laminarinivorans TaxID=2883124 RepID=A0A9X1L393_9FLAO|nr:two-component regulator propeller domain-containing protein [Tamlana laminarinivorans]MCB4798027.1 ABC transporter substrate-binding protein [Tamlana laminarinivorans]
MLKQLFVFLIVLFSVNVYSQDYSALWKGYFSYNQIIDVTKGDNKVFAASTNAVFSFDTVTNNLEEISTINGLSGGNISTLFYSATYKLLVIGYETGLIEIVFDDDDDVLTLVDIVDKVTISPTNKQINHFNALDNQLYISTNFGITVFNLERLEFGDTYFIGDNGAQIQVNQTTIYNDYIYAACADGNGIRKASVSSPFLIDYQNWETLNTNSWNGITATETNLYAIRNNNSIYSITNDAATQLNQYNNAPLKLRYDNGILVVSTANNVFAYNSDFSLLTQADVNPLFVTEFTSAIADGDNLYMGTEDFGILKTSLSNTIDYEEIHPDGPLLNIPFSIETSTDGLWVTFGEYTGFFNPYPLNSRGISHLKYNDWVNISYDDVFEAKSLNHIAVNPNNFNQVFVSSFFSGLLEVNDDLPTTLYNETNSGLNSLSLPNNPNYIDIRVGPSEFDSNGLLWTLTSLAGNPLKSFNPVSNQWEVYSFAEITGDAFESGNLGYTDIEIGNDGTKWTSCYNFGLIGYNEANGGQIKSISTEDENMPSNWATALALDNQNQLWIGTYRGLRVLYNTSGFFTDDDVQVYEIIIEENGEAEELLFQQYVTAIEVDGSNNKWVGTDNSGLFHFSSDGQNTIYHFTTDNSPLPSNSIRDISLNLDNGTVYIATSQGLVSFSSGSSSASNDLQNAFAYPNPVRPGFDISEDKVKIKDFSENVNIKITDIAGNLVAEAQSNVNERFGGYNLEIDGGIAYWNGKNFANNIVASGVYLVMILDLDSYETKVIKLMVVR